MLKEGTCTAEYLDELKALGNTMQVASKCGLGQTSSSAFLSILEHFGDEIHGRATNACRPRGASMSNPSHARSIARRSRSSTGASSPPPARTPSAPTVAVTIDGIETKVPLGTTILEAAKSIGVRIPTLCYHPDLEVAGICRICVVEVEGQRTLQAACAYPITARSRSTPTRKAVRIARRHVLDLLLSEHCGDCYSCIRNGNCELQTLAEEYGVDNFRFGHAESPRPTSTTRATRSSAT